MTLATDTNLINADLIPSLQGPPHELFHAWRATDPVHWNPAPDDYTAPMPGASVSQGFWVLTRYDDVWKVSRNQLLFSSHVGSPVIWDFEPEQLAMQQANFMGMEPEQHLQVKRLVMPPFSAAELKAFEPEIAEVAKEIVDEIIDQGECEFVFDVASKLPVYTFCKLLGVPEKYKDRVYVLGNKVADTENPNRADEGQDTLFELFSIAQEVVADKRENPDNSMMSRLVHGELDGEKLDDMQLNMFFLTLAIAGHETTRGTATHFLRLMAEYPDQYELLRSDPDKYIPNAIDEVLRFSPPVIKFRRTATQDTKLGDKDIKEGDKVYLSYPAANRDPDVFENPDVFDITRENAGKHLAFGTGQHVCLGARLAHIQLFHLLKEIVTRMPDFELMGEPTFLRSIWFNAVINMPIKWTPPE